nr:hypothetical protein [Rickettsia endosymbiont of Ceutorhynchus assimilis]
MPKNSLVSSFLNDAVYSSSHHLSMAFI